MDTLASTDERLDPEHAAQTEDAKDRFREAFGKLPRREREIAVLLYVKGMTLARSARSWACPRAASARSTRR